LPSSNQIRESFLKFFERNGHRIVPSSSLIPYNDPTLLFTNAGMNQFKDVFLGREERPYRRATTSQKCMRVSGKHNDFRDVGHSTRHHTFFEMLGNFSFGDYFKEDAIRFAWDLVTRDFGIDPARLWVTVYRDDDDAFKIWNQAIAVPAGKIFRLGEKDNFWAMGDTGPCGPCSELHYDFGKSPLPGHPECDLTCSCGRWVEIWNLVFMQFNRDGDGNMTPLPSPSIDTGMGFERITAILQDKTTNYDTDLFQPLLQEVSRISNTSYGSSATDDISMRIIADHARAAAFAIADGQYPGNDKRGYVIRKIMRRAVVHGKKLGIEDAFFYRVAGVVGDLMKGAYPELVSGRETIARVIKQEEDAFADTLSQGLRDFYDRTKRLKAEGSNVLPGEEAFYLYDTRGLPLEIIDDLAAELELAVDEAGFNEALEAQRERSRQDYVAGKVRPQVAETLFEGSSTFVGYGYQEPVRAKVRAIMVDGERAESISAGQKGEIVLEPTPFYAESGGQVGDTGFISSGVNEAAVTDTLYRGSSVSQMIEVSAGSFQVGDEVEARVDLDRRQATMKNHTATHLLQAALKRVLGPHVKQAGSLVAPDRLRFDFTHFAPLSPAEIERVEDEVNAQIWRDARVVTTVMPRDQAMNSGATALFGEKYQEEVRVVEVPGFSRELCGGTHVPATGTIGLFKIISEAGIAAGIRRLEAVTGPGALLRFRNDAELLDVIQEQFRVSRPEIPALVEKMQAQVRDLQRQIGHLKVQVARANLSEILSSARKVRGVNVLAAALPSTDRSALREIADDLKSRLGSCIIVLGSDQEGKVALVAMVTDDLSRRVPAGKVIKEIAPLVGGSGGGRPELAEAGGKDSSGLADAIERTYAIVEAFLAG
jgi:alanyl-tRNA synthetase